VANQRGVNGVNYLATNNTLGDQLVTLGLEHRDADSRLPRIVYRVLSTG
jgi:hypothetical protein